MKLLLFILFFSAVLKGQVINQIEMQNYGGEMGMHSKFTITKSTISYEYNKTPYGHNIVKKSKKNSKFKIEDIINKAELKSFTNLKSGKSRLPVDGTDTDIIVKTNQQIYLVKNADYKNELWNKIQLKLNKIINSEFLNNK